MREGGGAGQTRGRATWVPGEIVSLGPIRTPPTQQMFTDSSWVPGPGLGAGDTGVESAINGEGQTRTQTFLEVRRPRGGLPSRKIKEIVLEEVAPGQPSQDGSDLAIIIIAVAVVCQAPGKGLPLRCCNRSS